MEKNIFTLTEEIHLLNNLSKDLSFDSSVISDAKSLIDIKNKEIVDSGGDAVIFDIKQEIGIPTQELLDRISVQLKALYPFRNSEKAGAKYRTLSRIFKLKSGLTFEEFRDKGSKFLYGGVLGNYTNNILSNLEKTNQFFILRETDKDAVLKYTTPENSVLLQVLLPNTNVAYGLSYPLGKNTVIDFYQDEALTRSMNISYTFSATFDEETFKKEYVELMKQLEEAEKKYYS